MIKYLRKINSNNLNKLGCLIYGQIYKIIFYPIITIGKRPRLSPFSRLINKRNLNIGCDFDLKFGSSISGVKFECGNNVSIGSGSHIIGHIEMGDDIRVAQNVVIVSNYYGIKGKGLFLEQKGYSKGKILIDNGVWVGANSVILSGVHIGEGACIGAGSVVTRDVEPYTVVAGNPAKLIKHRIDS